MARAGIVDAGSNLAVTLGILGLLALSLPGPCLAQNGSKAEDTETTVLRGKDGFLFFKPELRALTAGPFWGADAAKVSRASKEQYADPLPAILDFHQQLKKAGIELLFVPVPAKAAIYPDKLPDNSGIAAGKPGEAHKAFYALLRDKGVSVLDLTDRFLMHRDDAGGGVFLKTDTHWSGQGVQLAARAIVDAIQWKPDTKKAAYATEDRKHLVTGDLSEILESPASEKESISLTHVGVKNGEEITPIEVDRESPVLLIGDSHTLVFHDPDLLAKGAGLPDHLALHFGFPVDLVGVMGSAATESRINLYRRKDELEGKKVVIWVTTMREFTESISGWRKVPIIK